MRTRTYLDHNATSPLRPEARDAMIAAFDLAGNPSSVHGEGRAARDTIETAREIVARALGTKPSAVTFTSGGTEAANWLLQPSRCRRLAVSAVEHPCVLRGHRFDEPDARTIPVDAHGLIDLTSLGYIIDEATCVAVQAANNETGVAQPIQDIIDVARSVGASVVCDAVQAIGRMDLNALLGADAVFFSAHKFGGPKGVGIAVLRDGWAPSPLIRGGGQERRHRSGTENVPAIAGAAAALLAATREQLGFIQRATELRAMLERGIKAIAPHAIVFGEAVQRLPNTSCFAVPGRSAETMLIDFDLAGVAVSSGSACSSGKVERSHVLSAMGISPDLSAGAIRVSTGWNTSETDVERFLTVFSDLCGNRRGSRAA